MSTPTTPAAVPDAAVPAAAAPAPAASDSAASDSAAPASVEPAATSPRAPGSPAAAAPTGRQFELRAVSDDGRENRAVVTELGAMLRVLEADGVPLIEGFDESVYPTFCAGWMLIPWPNRVRDARWHYDGADLQLPITEPDRGNALHGFVFDLRHTVVDSSPASITLRALIEPTAPYPFALTVDTTFTLAPATPATPATAAAPATPATPGTAATPVLTVTHAITNTGDRDAPAAVGAHPYFRIGDVATEQLTVTVNAATRVTVDDRLNPTGTAPVTGTPYDLSQGAVVGTLDLDTAYLDLTPAPDGRFVQTIAAPDGRRIELWGDSSFDQAQVFTTQIFPRSGGLGWAVTVEPTTAAPDALNSGHGLHWIAPGDTWTVSWGIDFAPVGGHDTLPAEPAEPDGPAAPAAPAPTALTAPTAPPAPPAPTSQGEPR
ncbi:aldose 1-epimerase family protein [Subtercola sp. YIM 133946]|uniref:aldose 1-epimerase family protein n=1 Tax=Subtercola sp. YIM 133946 TaxID=3118909 RepID=UPI002F95F075